MKIKLSRENSPYAFSEQGGRQAWLLTMEAQDVVDFDPHHVGFASLEDFCKRAPEVLGGVLVPGGAPNAQLKRGTELVQDLMEHGEVEVSE